MNIDTLLEAAKYVDSGGILDHRHTEQSFTRGKDSNDDQDKGRQQPSPGSHKQFTGSSFTRQKDILTKKNSTPFLAAPESSAPVLSSLQQVHTVPVATKNVPVSSTIITQSPSYLSCPSTSAYHVFAQIPQQSVKKHSQQVKQRHSNLQQTQSIHQFKKQPLYEQQQESTPGSVKSSSLNIQPTLSQQPPPPPPPSLHPGSVPSHSHVSPQQAVDLLQLAKGQGGIYTTFTTSSASWERSELSGNSGNASPRLVHQIVSHNQWVASETQASPKSSGLKLSLESDSADSNTDGNGKDKRAGIREVHNKLEKNRRAHMKECFENLRTAVPSMEDKKSKTSNLSILRGALKYIQVLIRKERELEHELDRLVRQKIENQQRLDLLKIKNGMSTSEPVKIPVDTTEEDDDDGEGLVVSEEKDIEVVPVERSPVLDDDQASTSTASEAEEEERKSQVQSRSQSPQHHPVSTRQSHPSNNESDKPLNYHQAYASIHASSVEGTPFVDTTPYDTSVNKSADGVFGSSTELRTYSAEVGMQHGPGKGTSYLQRGLDSVSTVLQNVASQIAPTSKCETTSTTVSQSGVMMGNSTRQTVSQLLGKQPVVRQPVRRQLSVSQLPVIQPPIKSHILPRIMGTPQVRLGFNQNNQSVLGPSKPVVTVGINSFLAQPSVIQTVSTHRPVVSTSTGLTTGSYFTKPDTAATTTSLNTLTIASPVAPVVSAINVTSTKSIMTASVITQTLPVMSHAAHSPFISPIALHSPAVAATSILLTHPAPSYIGLPPAMITQPFIGAFPATRAPHMQVTTSTQVTPSPTASKPLVHPTVQPVTALGNSSISLALAQAAGPSNMAGMSTGMFHTSVSVSNPVSSNAAVSPDVKLTVCADTESTEATTAGVVAKHKPSFPVTSPAKISQSKHGRSVNGRTEVQLTTSKIAETMASVGTSTQSMAKNGQSSAAVTS